MNAIKENPYRTLGLFGNATEKELQKQLSTLKAFARVGKSKSFDYDFPFLGDIKREEQTITAAASNIEQAKNKVHYSLFWFLNTNHIDEAALNHLKEANIDKATEIWEKILKDNAINTKNYSAALNLSTLQLGMITLNGSFNPTQLRKCVELKGHILTSEAFMNFVQTVAGDNTSVSKETIRKEFVDEILQILKPYLNKTNGVTSALLIEAFNSFPTETKQYIASKFTDRPISNIEDYIEKAKQSRTEDASNAEEYGAELYKQAKEDLAFLENVLGVNNVNYQVIVNKVANEILQCAIDFFIEYRDSDEYDPGDEALKLMQMSKAISPTGQTKTRVDDNIVLLLEWIEGKSERDLIQKVKDDFEFVAGKLDRFQELYCKVENAKDLVVSCKPKLDNMRRVLGSTNVSYLNISSAVVSNAMGMMVTAINDLQDRFQTDVFLKRDSTISNMRAVLQASMEVTAILGSFDMNSELRERYNSNKSALQGIYFRILEVCSPISSSSPQFPSSTSQIRHISRPFTHTLLEEDYENNSASRKSSKDIGGCYIATMAYGSYEHPQVMELRKFRDEILATTALGRMIISFYYNVSPKLVALLKGKSIINSAIRTSLNAFIRIMK